MEKKKRLSKGIRKYIRRQKMIIRGLVRDKAEEDRLIRELLDRFYKDQKQEVNKDVLRRMS
ncbi:MAG: hypothetical protein D4S01_01810 [Dehalococcoidia bacterium]|nr:MAG: hypothetical protein D4S01_01810 [Dehalococcoidia bacterium]